MDTSKEYIKMCEKAVEIQKLWKPKNWDCFYGSFDAYAVSAEGNRPWIISGYETDGGYYGPDLESYDKKECDIWLPRQDQLQEMVVPESKYGKGSKARFTETFDKFGFFTNEYYIETSYPIIIFETFEQLWLAFVMSDKYQKTWNGTEWVKERG